LWCERVEWRSDARRARQRRWIRRGNGICITSWVMT
jgi:hypothetical protein